MFKRVGGKSKSKDLIISKIPEHRIYVEPFVGGGSVFFGKEPSDHEIINDLDTDIYNIYSDMKVVGSSMIRRQFDPSRERFEELKASTTKNKSDRLFRNLYISLMSYSGNRSTYMGEKEEQLKKDSEIGIKYKTDKWHVRLKDVHIENKDFKKVITKYDSSVTFFFLDPPYSENNPNWGYTNNVSPIDVYNAVREIEGKFLITYDDTPEIRRIFKGYKIVKFNVIYELSGQRTQGNELMIMNY